MVVAGIAGMEEVGKCEKGSLKLEVRKRRRKVRRKKTVRLVRVLVMAVEIAALVTERE